MLRARTTLLIVLALGICLPIVGQTVDRKNAELIDSFGTITNGDLRGRGDLFMATLQNQPESQGLIVIYGTPVQVRARKRLWTSQFAFRRFPAERIRYQVGGNVSEFRTDLWLIPAGAAPPEIKPEAWILRELRTATKASITKAMSDANKELRKLSDHQLYIINYGTQAKIAQREKWIRDGIPFRRFDSYRITLVNGGKAGTPRTVMWLVPPRADNPTP